MTRYLNLTLSFIFFFCHSQNSISAEREQVSWKRAKVIVARSEGIGTLPVKSSSKKSALTLSKPVARSTKGSSNKKTVKNTPKKLVKPSSKTIKKTVKPKKVYYKTIQKPKPVIVPSNTIREVNSPSDERLEKALITSLTGGSLKLASLPSFSTAYRGNVAALSTKGEFIQFTLDEALQEYAQSLVSKTPAPHVAVVVMEPSTGRILAIAGKSTSIKNLPLHAGFPAASLFKVVTTSAALEKNSIIPDSLIPFRGGTYELDETNYRPHPTRDNRIMSVAEALGRSCNPVFGRLAFNYLNPTTLRYYANAYGFNTSLQFQTGMEDSKAYIPNDEYELSRTAAGFGNVFVSPLHAASFMSGVANGGNLPRPYFIDQVINNTGDILYKTKPQYLQKMIKQDTASDLLQMMIYTTTVGTSKREFYGKTSFTTSAKTGTLRGTNPKGLNNWFIGAAPSNAPRAVVSVVVVNPSSVSSKASHLGRLLLEKALS